MMYNLEDMRDYHYCQKLLRECDVRNEICPEISAHQGCLDSYRSAAHRDKHDTSVKGCDQLTVRSAVCPIVRSKLVFLVKIPRNLSVQKVVNVEVIAIVAQCRVAGTVRHTNK